MRRLAILALIAGAAWWFLTRDVRKTPIFEGCGAAPEGTATPATLAVD